MDNLCHYLYSTIMNYLVFKDYRNLLHTNKKRKNELCDPKMKYGQIRILQDFFRYILTPRMKIKWSLNFSMDGPFTNKKIISLNDKYSIHDNLLSSLKHGNYIMAKMKNESDFKQYKIFQIDKKYVHGWTHKSKCVTFLMIGWWNKDKICELYSNKEND